MLGYHRIAEIRCVVLVQDDDSQSSFREVASVSVKLHGGSILTSPVETVTVQTQRQAALWQDAHLWRNSGQIWRRSKFDDTHFHLLEVFAMAKNFCDTGVSSKCCLLSAGKPQADCEILLWLIR